MPAGRRGFQVIPETLDHRAQDRLTSETPVISETHPHRSDSMIDLTTIALIARPSLENHAIKREE